MLGFLALSIASAPRMTHIPWQPFASEHARGLGGFAVGISIALWNYIGWDNPSTVQGEVKDPSRTYPRALAIALPLVTIGYSFLCSPRLAPAIGPRGLKVVGRKSPRRRLEMRAAGSQSGLPSAE